MNSMDQEESSNNTSIHVVGTTIPYQVHGRILALNFVGRVGSLTYEESTNIRDHPARNQKPAFSQYLARMVTNVYPNIPLVLLGFLAKLISDKVINWGSDPFEGVCGDSNNASNVSLKFNEAFQKFLPDMAHMTLFIMAYAAALILTLLLSKVLEATLVSLAPFYYFPPSLTKAPNFSVIICGTSLLPVFWFQLLWALVFSLLQGFVILLVLFISWKNHMPTPNLESAVPFETGESNDTSNEQTMEEASISVVEIAQVVQTQHAAGTSPSTLSDL